jgi:hypothetical protein
MKTYEVTTKQRTTIPTSAPLVFEADDFSSYDGVLSFSRYNVEKQRNEEFYSMNKDEWVTVRVVEKTK